MRSSKRIPAIAGRAAALVALSILLAAAAPGRAYGRTYRAGPDDCQATIKKLKPGDELHLAAGEYSSGLRFADLHGREGAPIVVSGPATGAPALLYASDRTMKIDRCSYLVIRHLTLERRNKKVAHAINAGGGGHHVTLEYLTIRNHGAGQQACGLAANDSKYYWNWTVRNCTITAVGTGMYLGNNSGRGAFVTALIENNVILDTVGYNIEFKVQKPRPDDVPEGVTIIRNNVFSKIENAARGKDDGARPNLLVDPFPASGRGSNDMYLIYGNFFYQNYESDALFQGTGNIAFYNNVLFNDKGSRDAVHIQGHNGTNRKLRVFFNTIVAAGNGIKVSRTEGTDHYVFGNAVFAGKPLGLDKSVHSADNVTGTFESAAKYLLKPAGPLDTLDFFPKRGTLRGAPMDVSSVKDLQDWDIDFNGVKRKGIMRGAYAGEGRNPGWKPSRSAKDTKKPEK